MARSARGSPGGAPELHRADRRRVGGEAEDGLSTPVAGDRCQVSPSRTRGEVRSIVIARADLGSTLSPRRSARLPDVSTDREIGAAGCVVLRVVRIGYRARLEVLAGGDILRFVLFPGTVA